MKDLCPICGSHNDRCECPEEQKEAYEDGIELREGKEILKRAEPKPEEKKKTFTIPDKECTDCYTIYSPNSNRQMRCESCKKKLMKKNNDEARNKKQKEDVEMDKGIETEAITKARRTFEERERPCADCKKDISDRHKAAKRCVKCQDIRAKKQIAKYNKKVQKRNREKKAEMEMFKINKFPGKNLKREKREIVATKIIKTTIKKANIYPAPTMKHFKTFIKAEIDKYTKILKLLEE